MSDFPSTDFVLPLNITTTGLYSHGGIMIAAGLSSGTTAWPANDNAYFIPVTLPAPFLVRTGFWHNGGTVSGTVDFGIYGLDQSLIVSCGLTAQSGANGPQLVSLTETLLSPGSYYLALSCSNTTATFSRSAFSDEQHPGVLKANTLHPLTTLPTLIAATNDYQPYMGISPLASF